MEVSDGAVAVLAGLLERRTGQQLAIGRRWRIDTALRPLMQARGEPDLDALTRRIVGGSDPLLADAVIEALINHETFFFRDHAAFLLLEKAFVRLQAARVERRRLRIWSAGCSTGQETYSLAMMIADQGRRWDGWTVDILGTDVSAHAIERARIGRYSQFEIQRGLPVTQMVRRFDQQGEDWQANERLRRAVTFRTHNLLTAPPPGLFDIVLCRNVLLYFNAATRRVVFDRLGSAIAPDGVLMLGAGETALGQTERFVSDDQCRGLYRPQPLSAPEQRPLGAAMR